MAIILQGLDSPELRDQQSSFVGGQTSNAVPLQISENSCKLLEDCETSVNGQAETRRGTAILGDAVGSGSLIRGVSFYQTPALGQLPLAISDTLVKKYSSGTWTTFAGGAETFTNGTSPVIFAIGNGYVYATDGAGNIKRSNGTVWTHLSTDTPPTNVSLLVWHTNRLIASGVPAAPDAIYFSDFLSDTVWASTAGGYQLQPGAGDGIPITAIVPWTSFNLAVFKNSSTWLVGADPALNVSDMPVQMIHGRIGCIAPRSAAQVGGDIMFLSADGIRSLNQTIATDNRYDLGQPLSFNIQDVINRINLSAASKAVATFWKGKYILAVPLDASTSNNYLIVWNSITGKWFGGWRGLPINCFSPRADSGTDKLMLGMDGFNYVIEYLDYVQDSNTTDATFTDYGVLDVNPRIVTRGMVFGDFYSPKKGISANIVLNKSKGQLNITAIFDEGATEVQRSIVTGDPAAVHFPITFPLSFPRVGLQVCSFDLMEWNPFHQLQFEIEGVGPGRKEIRQISCSAFPEATDLQGQIVSMDANT